MTEAQIERHAERVMDGLDRLLLKGEIDQENYDRRVLDLNQWVKNQPRKRR